MGFLDFLKFWDKRKNMYMKLDEETIKTNETIKAQQQVISSQQAQLSKIKSNEKIKKDIEKQKDKDSDLNKALVEQRKDIDANKKGKVIKLSKFYKLLLNSKKFRNKLEICDKNDETVLGKFGDFIILEGGNLGMTFNDGNIASMGKTLSQVIYKPDSFENQARRGRFLCPVDKDGYWLEDLDYKEVNEPLDAQFDEETGKIKWIEWSKVKKTEVKKLIASKLEQVNYLTGEIERLETVMQGLKDELYNKDRAMKNYETQVDVAQSDLSKTIDKFNSAFRRVGDMQSQIIKLTELKATYENLLDRKDAIIEQVLRKLELTGDPRSDRIKAGIKDDLEFYKAILPDTVQNIVPEEKPQILPTQPGEVIKK